MISLVLLLLLALTTIVYICTAVLFVLGLMRGRPGASGAQPTVSVVIAARNEERCIAGCLSDLAGQTYPAVLYEVIVVDDGSTDRTSEIVRDQAGRHRMVRLVSAPDPSVAGLSPKKNALDAGIRRSTGEIILTTDADCRLPATWIEGMVRHFIPDVGVVVGLSQIDGVREELTFFERLQALDFLALMSAAAGSAYAGFPLAASGQNLGYRRRAFLDVDGFNRIGHRVSGDDVLLLQLIRTQTPWKATFAGTPEVTVSTAGQKSLKGFLEQRKRWASNGAYQIRLNKAFFAYLAAVFTMNILLLILVPYALVGGEIGGGIPASWRVHCFILAQRWPGDTLHAATGLCGSSWHLPLSAVPVFCLIAKCSAELAVILKGAALFGRRKLMAVFPAWTLLEVPYVVWMGFSGSSRRFDWKGRRHGRAGR